MTFNSGVDVDDVRTELSDIPPSLISDSVIVDAIEDSELFVSVELDDDWPDNLPKEIDEETKGGVESMLVKRRAARKAWTSSPAEVRRQAIDAVVSYDIQEFRGKLNSRVDEVYELMGIHQDGDRAAFADVTGHAPGGGSRERLRRAGTKYPGAWDF